MRGGRRIKVSNARAGALPQTASGNFTEMWKTYRGRGSRRAAPALTNRTRARTPRPRTCRGLRSHFHILMYLSRSSRRRARSPARLGGLTADARYLPHLSPPPHQEPDGTPKQNGQQRTCHECSPPIAFTKGRGAAPLGDSYRLYNTWLTRRKPMIYAWWFTIVTANVTLARVSAVLADCSLGPQNNWHIGNRWREVCRKCKWGNRYTKPLLTTEKHLSVADHTELKNNNDCSTNCHSSTCKQTFVTDCTSERLPNPFLYRGICLFGLYKDFTLYQK